MDRALNLRAGHWLLRRSAPLRPPGELDAVRDDAGETDGHPCSTVGPEQVVTTTEYSTPGSTPHSAKRRASARPCSARSTNSKLPRHGRDHRHAWVIQAVADGEDAALGWRWIVDDGNAAPDALRDDLAVGLAWTPPPNSTRRFGEMSLTTRAGKPRRCAAVSGRSSGFENQQVVPDITRAS